MARRMIIMLVAVVLFIAAIGYVKFTQISAAIAQGKSYAPPPETVTTATAKAETWPATTTATGSIAAVQGVMLSADIPGVVKTIQFTSGSRVQSGAVLVTLDTAQERAQLAALVAQRELARTNFERSKKLLEQQLIAQAEYDQVSALYKQAEANAGEVEAAIHRKQIRAPFSGVTGIRQVNLGQYLHSGDPVVSLQTVDPVYVNFALPQQDIAQLHVGAEVRVSTDTLQRSTLPGRLTSINSVVDESTRNVQLQATLRNPGGAFRPGMFVMAHVSLGRPQTAITLPTSAINYAPYGSSVFVVETMKDPAGKPYRGVRQAFVTVGPARGDQVAILSGVKSGEEVVSSGVFKLRNGAAVTVNNKVQPGNLPAPKPEDS